MVECSIDLMERGIDEVVRCCWIEDGVAHDHGEGTEEPRA